MIGKNRKNIIAYILIFVAVIATMRLPVIANGDELWTFANTYKFCNGISLYNQNNIIVTPLFFWIGKIIFEILSPTFFTYKIYNIILILFLYITVYRLLKLCKINSKISLILTILCMLSFKIINNIGANYTILALIFLVAGVINLIQNKDKKPNIIYQGIIVFLILLTKQNIAVYYTIGLIIYILTKKNKIKNFIKLGITIAIPILAFLCYEFYKGELYSFINYAFLGIGEFAQNNIIIEGHIYTQILIAFQIVSIILGISQINENRKKNNKDEILNILFIFSIVNIMLGYPIFNLYHVSTGSIIPTVLVSYILVQYLKKIKIEDDVKEIIKGTINKCIVLLATILTILCGKYIYDWHNIIIQSKLTKDDPFYGGIISEDEIEYEDVINFIKDKEKNGYNVIIFDISANFYMVPLEKNNQNYDLPMLGNWGKNGENKILEDVKSKSKTYFLTYDETRNITTQESKKIKTYIKENLKNEGKIGKYDIYYKE